MSKERFKKIVWAYYKAHGRHTLLWRTNTHTRYPYRILVSEVMLQQTQVSRVIKKYPEFIRLFPDFRALAKAPTRAVLQAWSGLGYNRRALHLKHIADILMRDYGGRLPNDPITLRELPGIGVATAGSIAAFAFNKPAVFIETNIRRAFIHSFFPKKNTVNDDAIGKLVRETLDAKRPREWYYALMDYGAMLGEREKENPNTRSTGYRTQSPFAGSRRALRGKVLRFLLPRGKSTERTLVTELKEPIRRMREVLEALEREKFVVRTGSIVKLL